MLKISELAMPKSRKVTTICNGRREVWTDYEEAKAYFLELMMSTDGEEHDRGGHAQVSQLRQEVAHRNQGEARVDGSFAGLQVRSGPVGRQEVRN